MKRSDEHYKGVSTINLGHRAYIFDDSSKEMFDTPI